MPDGTWHVVHVDEEPAEKFAREFEEVRTGGARARTTKVRVLGGTRK